MSVGSSEPFGHFGSLDGGPGGTPGGLTACGETPFVTFGTDDAPALNTEIVTQKVRGGSVICVGPGTHNLVTPVIDQGGGPGVAIKCAGRGATIWRANDPAGNMDVFTFKNVNGCRLTDCSIIAGTARTGGAMVRSIGGDPTLPIGGAYVFGANGLAIERVDLTSPWTGFQVNDAAGPLVGNWLYYLNECRVSNPRGGDGFLLDATSGASHFVQRLFVYNTTGTGGGTGAGIHVKCSGDANFQECETFSTPYGILIDTAGAGALLNAARFARCFFDSGTTRTGLISIDATRSSWGDIKFLGCWFGSSVSDGMYITGVGVATLSFSDSTFIHSAGWGCQLNSTQQVDFANCLFAANATGGFVASGSQHFSINGGRALSNAGLFNVVQPFGYYINVGCDYYIVNSVDAHDNTTPFTDVALGAHRIATVGTNILV